MNQVVSSELPLLEKIERFVDHYITLISENPDIPAFIIHELNQNPEAFIQMLLSLPQKSAPMQMAMQLEAEIKAGHIKPIQPLQLVVNIISLCVFPFVAKPMIQGLLGVPENQFQEFMESRKKEVAQFIIDAIKV